MQLACAMRACVRHAWLGHCYKQLSLSLSSLFFSVFLLFTHFGESPVCANLFPPSGSKAKDGGKEERKRPTVGDNNGQATHGARKPPGPKKLDFPQFSESKISEV